MFVFSFLGGVFLKPSLLLWPACPLGLTLGRSPPSSQGVLSSSLPLDSLSTFLVYSLVLVEDLFQ